MSERTRLVLTLAALPPHDPQRTDVKLRLHAGAHRPQVIDAKLRDFVTRRLVTSADPNVMQLTAAGRRALDRLGASS